MAVLFVLFLALVTATDHRGFLASADKKNCTYTFLVQTTCASNAATSDHVSLRFGDVAGTDVLVHRLHGNHVRRVDAMHASDVDDVPQQPFRPCGVDQFRVTGSCVKSPVCYLYLKQTGPDRWRPGLAQVLVEGDHFMSSKSFYFRRFLPQHVWHGSDTCDTGSTPFGVKFTRKVLASS